MDYNKQYNDSIEKLLSNVINKAYFWRDVLRALLWLYVLVLLLNKIL